MDIDMRYAMPYMILMGVVPKHEDSLYIDCHLSVLI
jgi:hypothetical protein